MIHTVQGFSVANEADVFLQFAWFFYDPMDLHNLISGSSTFLNPFVHLEVLGSCTAES